MMNNQHTQLVPIEELVPLIQEQLKKGGRVRFTPRGVSMQPMLRHGVDTVILSPVRGRLKKYDLPFYRRKNGNYVLHRIVAVKDNYTCIGDNQYHKEKGITDDQLIAVVSSFIRNGREYGVDGVGYKIYCRFWNYTRFLRRVLRFIKHRTLRLLRKRR